MQLSEFCIFIIHVEPVMVTFINEDDIFAMNDSEKLEKQSFKLFNIRIQ